MSLSLTTFDMAALLDSDETISEYLSQVLADGDHDELIRALGYIAKARGMSQIATASGLGRESLYKALTPGAKPRFDTVLKVIRALGLIFWPTSCFVETLSRPHSIARQWVDSPTSSPHCASRCIDSKFLSMVSQIASI